MVINVQFSIQMFLSFFPTSKLVEEHRRWPALSYLFVEENEELRQNVDRCPHLATAANCLLYIYRCSGKLTMKYLRFGWMGQKLTKQRQRFKYSLVKLTEYSKKVFWTALVIGKYLLPHQWEQLYQAIQHVRVIDRIKYGLSACDVTQRFLNRTQ